ncbi:hypothetical protein B0T09DRAFT_375275 [Sordaria sp. MPI-SDFR-AT-0083]|nr:hypothetical protein B0T09DRAFT_375275 [Sordaria sp. MPI-SDFR-AT-0083]
MLQSSTVIMDPSPPTAAESSPEDLSPPKTASPKPASPEPSSRETPSSKPSSQESSSQEALPTPPKTPPPSVHGPKSATPKCFKCKSLDILPVRTLFRMSEGAEPGRKELLSVFIQGAGLYDIPLCSVCFMRAKGCSAFRWRLRSCKAFWRSTEMDAAAILYEEHTWRFDTELVRHGQRMKDADELIDYVRRLDKPSVENRRAPESPDEQEIWDRMPDFDLTSHLRYDGSETTLTFDGIANTHEEHRQRLIGERDPQPSLRSLWEYPVQITDLIALKEASERYIVALGRTSDASEQWRSMRQLLNKLADDFMRLPPIMHSEAPAATNAAVSDPTPVYCEICQWCRDCLAEL